MGFWVFRLRLRKVVFGYKVRGGVGIKVGLWLIFFLLVLVWVVLFLRMGFR